MVVFLLLASRRLGRNEMSCQSDKVSHERFRAETGFVCHMNMDQAQEKSRTSIRAIGGRRRRAAPRFRCARAIFDSNQRGRN
jgi:hypothetical protein